MLTQQGMNSNSVEILYKHLHIKETHLDAVSPESREKQELTTLIPIDLNPFIYVIMIWIPMVLESYRFLWRTF